MLDGLIDHDGAVLDSSPRPNFRDDEVAREFERATAIEPDIPDIASNFRSYCGLLLSSGPVSGADAKVALGRDELSRGLAALQGVKTP